MTGTDLSSDGHPFTYALRVQSVESAPAAAARHHDLRRRRAGRRRDLRDRQNILAYFPSGTGYTGYVTGGWTGIGPAIRARSAT